MTTRITTHTYDFRGNRISTDGELDLYQKTYYDNLGRTTKSERYDTTSGGNLIARSETNYDDRGRVYQTVRHAVDPSTGTVGNALTDNTWYDEAGNVIKQHPAGSEVFTKTEYDSLGRAVKTFTGYDVSESTYAEADDVTGDTILEQTELTYDDASNNIQSSSRQRYHNATGTGELGTPSSSQPKARVTHTASYPDPIGRQLAAVNYGTDGGTAFTRSSTIPARSDNVLVTSMEFGDTGQVVSQTSPGDVMTCLTYDDAGRQVQQILNCVQSSSSSSSSSLGALDSDDVNVTVVTGYNADGNVETITAQNAITGDQTTTYVYGTTLSDSGIASSQLKRAEIYPDSDDVASPLGDGTDATYDRIEYEYNRQGQVTEIKDQNATVHAFDYDVLGRQTHDRITTLGSGVDGAIRRISTTFEVRGMKEKITSYDNATVGSGNIANEVQFSYNDFGQVTHDYQAHGAAVVPATSPKVQYAYADGSAGTVRPTSLTYPDGRVVTYDYGTANGVNDAVSRIGSIIDDDGPATHLADYEYLGATTFVEVDYTEPDLLYTLVGTAGGDDADTGDIYLGFDRFGRIKDSYWRDYGAAADGDRIKYGYDRNGGRTYRENTVAAANSKSFDELYSHDGVDRLQSLDRGDLNGGKTAISNKQFAQDWALDATGNWRNFREDADGNATWDLDQQRTANTVNEITDIAETTGPSWVTPVYNRAGNMTTIPKPADPTASFAATYDAWNRLVKIVEGANTVAEYEYDAAKRRTVKKTYLAGVLDSTRHLYYTEPSRWQVIEERVDASSNAERQFIWGLRYVDDLILRERDTTSPANGILNERLYSLQDANWNMTALANTSGAIQERYAYTAYGTPIFLNGSFSSRSSSSYDWDRLFAGYIWDAETEWFQVRNRVLHPLFGWIQRDPIGYADGQNLYGYARSCPTIFVDPSGMASVFCPILAAVATVNLAAALVSCAALLVPEAAELLELAACIGLTVTLISAVVFAIQTCEKDPCGNAAILQKLRELQEKIDELEKKLKELTEGNE